MTMIKEKGLIKKNNFEYIVYKPNAVAENMPLLLFLHGIGERGNDVFEVEKYALPKYMNKFEIPYIVLAPQCHKNNFWEYHLRDIEIMLEKVYKDTKYDKERVCILGCSMGAYGAWNILLDRPNLFKGIVSVAGGLYLPIPENLKKIKNKKILMYHGDADDVVDVNVSIDLFNSLKKCGSEEIELKIIKNDNHYLCSHAFKDDKLFEWLGDNI